MSAGGVVVIIVGPPPKVQNKSGNLAEQKETRIELEMIEGANTLEILHAAIAKLESEAE